MKKSITDSCRRLGLDFDKVWENYQTHGRCCEICGTSEEDLDQRLSIDHNHYTGKFRGFLCSNCNRGIGLLGDDRNRVLAAMMYLLRHENYEKMP